MAFSLKEIQTYIEKQSTRDQIGLLENLATIIFDGATAEFLELFSPQQFSALASRALVFMNERPAGAVSVRVYNPASAEQGWEVNHTALEVSLADCPFIVDSIRMYLKRTGITLHHLIHPILNIERDAGRRITQVFMDDSASSRSEAYELFLLDRMEDPRMLREIERQVRSVLADVMAATGAYEDMRRKCAEARVWLASLLPQAETPRVPDSAASLEEYDAFLEWLDEGNFIFLGYREYAIGAFDGVTGAVVKHGSGIGILRDSTRSRYAQPVTVSALPRELQLRMVGAPLLLITKTNAESTVHRSGRMDYIGIKEFDSEGQIIGERRFLGLFTSKAYSANLQEVPILRRKLKHILRLSRAKEGSHNFKQIINIFNSIPLPELFWLSVDELHRDISAIMSVEQEKGVRVMMRTDPLHRGFALMVVMPRERFNSAVRQRVQTYLAEKLRATHVDYYLAMVGDDESQVRFHFFFSTPVEPEDIDFGRLEREVTELTRTWDDRLRQAMGERLGEAGVALANQYVRILPAGYKAEIPIESAVVDLENLESLEDSGFRVALINPEKSRFAERTTLLRIYHPGTLALAELFPVLENLGLKVFEQISYQLGEVQGTTERTFTIDIFRVFDTDGRQIDIERDGTRLREALIAILTKEVTNDPLNRLVLSGSLQAREVALLCAYRGHMFQLKPATSLTFITRTLLGHPECAQKLFGLFQVRFDPEQAGDRAVGAEQAQAEFLQSLNAVDSLPEDEILRFLAQHVLATVRTNFYRGQSFISIKVESRQLEGIPEPKPVCEIFVSSPYFEAVHLRGGRIARGGLRWSDRPDDFRTEILGLMKTQMTKNTLIVPEGSKGGFVLKSPPSNRQELKEHVRQQYQTFIRGLLDLTDNIRMGTTVNPPNLVIYDGPDPYLVVAADKGTATFSDLANSISAEYDFWLGDAFASGGSHGYDHKKEAITARGAWECVTRHFREMGLDPRKDAFTAVGIGDMSGDVFGNGLLYSDKVRLLAAFNHLHIFIDPDPDPAASFRERQRLFKDPTLTWGDYDWSVLGAGGGIFHRHAKSINLSTEIQTLLGTDASTLSGQDVIRRILQLPVDLLWNGGIGTYVRASDERDTEVGDPSNDSVRIDATQLKARVVGEGGNLGLTQKARIEYNLLGGRINTDAVDNSGGVDMSDHEVNIKILLQQLLTQGRLSFEERNQVLQAMTDDVSRLVLRNNYTQSLCLSICQRKGAANLNILESLMMHLTREGRLKPNVEFLPDAKNLQARRREGKGMSRPELAILLAYTKMALKQELLQSDLPDAPILQRYLVQYFPALAQQRFAEDIPHHPLRREIVATQLTNLVIDRLGLSFLHAIQEKTAARPVEIVRAVLAAQEILSLPEFYDRLFAVDTQVEIEEQYRAIAEITRSMEGVVHWLLFSNADMNDLSAFVAKYQEPLRSLRSRLKDFLPAASERRKYQKRRDSAVRNHLPRELAHDLATVDYLPSCMGVVDIARVAEASIGDAAKTFYAIGDVFSLGILRDQLAQTAGRDRWEAIALGGLVMDLRFAQQQLTINYFRADAGSGLSVRDFVKAYTRLMEQIQHTLSEIKQRGGIDLASGSVLARQLFQLARQSERSGK